MGAASTKHLPELEEAQHQVRRLTAEKLRSPSRVRVPRPTHCHSKPSAASGSWRR